MLQDFIGLDGLEIGDECGKGQRPGDGAGSVESPSRLRQGGDCDDVHPGLRRIVGLHLEVSVGGVDGHDACECGGNVGGVGKATFALCGVPCSPGLIFVGVECVVQPAGNCTAVLKGRRGHGARWVASRLDRKVDRVDEIGDGGAIRRDGCRGQLVGARRPDNPPDVEQSRRRRREDRGCDGCWHVQDVGEGARLARRRCDVGPFVKDEVHVCYLADLVRLVSNQVCR